MRNWVLVCVALAGCGSDDKGNGGGNADANGGGGGADAKQFLDAPATTVTEVTVSGTATERDAQGGGVLAGVIIEAYRNANEGTPIAMTTTDGFGKYSLTIQTNGESIDGYLKATKTGLLTT